MQYLAPLKLNTINLMSLYQVIMKLLLVSPQKKETHSVIIFIETYLPLNKMVIMYLAVQHSS